MEKSFREALLESELPNKEDVAGLIRQRVVIHRDPAALDRQDWCVSRFGGMPDLPDGMAWPTWKGIPQSFVAQINLAELPDFLDRSLLPAGGVLYFFYDSSREADGYDPEEAGCFAVFYAAAPPPTAAPAVFPDGLPEEGKIIPARISFEVVENAPTWEDVHLRLLGLSFEDCLLAYSSLIEPYDDLHGEGHQLMGFESPVQHPPGLDCEGVRLKQNGAVPLGKDEEWERLVIGAAEWQLLLQVRSDDELNMYWPYDVGILYYMIRREDLLACRFDRAWMVKQYS